MDFDKVWHNLNGAWTSFNFSARHNLDLKSNNSLTKLDGSGSRVDEIVFGLTSRYLVTLSVFLGLSTLSSDLTGDDNLATDGISASHNVAKNVVGSKTDWSTIEELEFEGLNVGSSAEGSLKWKWFHRELKFVVSIVEVVSLFDHGFDLLDFTSLLVEEGLAVSGANTDLSAHASGTNFDTSVTVDSHCSAEELIELSLENTVSDELLFAVDLLNLLVSHGRVCFETLLNIYL